MLSQVVRYERYEKANVAQAASHRVASVSDGNAVASNKKPRQTVSGGAIS